MASELSGYLDVKVPAKVRKRGFTPWKAWKKQWCVVQPSEESGICIQIGSNSANTVQISPNSTFCHSSSRSRQFAFGVYTHIGQTRRPLIFLAGNSESESQKWMAHIRNLLHTDSHFDLHAQNGEGVFSVSIIDNTHAESAGLSGFYGLLTIGSCHINLSRSAAGEAAACCEWSQFHQFHLAATGKPEDENKICVIHTSSEFPAGPGQLYIYCLQAPKLLEWLLRRGRTRQPVAASMSLQSSRRLSRSESDLRCYCALAEASCASPSKFLRHPALVRSHSGSRDSGVRVSTASDDSGHDIQGKIANGLISAGLGLIFSTPGCSEADNESLHEYQHIGSYESEDEDMEQVAALFRTNSVSNTHSPRRESGISLASGIYEEIVDDVFPSVTDSTVQNHYENPAILGWKKLSEETSPPPPLPPRTPHSLAKCSMSEEALDERSRSPASPAFSSLNALRQTSFQGYSASCSSLTPLPSTPPWSKWSVKGQCNDPEPDYVPMSPRVPITMPNATHEESHYMVMASLKPS